MKQQAEKSAGVQEKYAALEAQYQALAAIVSASEGTEAIAKVIKQHDCLFFSSYMLNLYAKFLHHCPKKASILECFINITAGYIRFIIIGIILVDCSEWKY